MLGIRTNMMRRRSGGIKAVVVSKLINCDRQRVKSLSNKNKTPNPDEKC
jgi:hypothetical protein